jgi:hypothetical protein
MGSSWSEVSHDCGAQRAGCLYYRAWSTYSRKIRWSKPPRSPRLRLASDTMSSQLMPWGRGQSLQYLQHVGQLRGQLLIRSRLRFMRLLQQLRPQGRLIAGLVQNPGNSLMPRLRQ